MAINSRQKGARGEREFADELRKHGHSARRGVQYKGSVDSPDVVCDTLPALHFEVKRVQAGNLYTWLDQAERDAGEKIPIVAHKKNHRSWTVILRLDDFLDFCYLGGNLGRQTHGRGFDNDLTGSERQTAESSCERAANIRPGIGRASGDGKVALPDGKLLSAKRRRKTSRKGKNTRSRPANVSKERG